MRRDLTAAALLLLLAIPAASAARTLTMAEIFELSEYLECKQTCAPQLPAQSTALLAHEAYYTCLQENRCGVCAVGEVETCGPPRLWEKNGIQPVDKADLELALLEYQHHATAPEKLVCYRDAEETIVVPGAFCDNPLCSALTCTPDDCAVVPATCDAGQVPQGTDLCCEEKALPAGGTETICWHLGTGGPAHCTADVCDNKTQIPQPNPTAAQLSALDADCQDADGDGLPEWVEALGGLDDSQPDTLCGEHAPCSFQDVCTWSVDLGAGLCVPRDVSTCHSFGGVCTAFHLELAAVDDTEIIVYVHFDGTPVPARALDMYLVYDDVLLTLADARPLAPLRLMGKEVASSHLSNGMLRVSVLDKDGTHPIPTGPIVELSFLRNGGGATVIGFAGTCAGADDPAACEATADGLQAKSVAPLQGAVQQELTNDSLWGAPLSIGAAEDSAVSLRVRYGFDAPKQPMSYVNVPDAAALCARIPDCANEADELSHAVLLGRLAELQAGATSGLQTIEGVAQTGAYLAGGSEHLRLPVHYVDPPLVQQAQSFTFSTWFYVEESGPTEAKGTPRTLFSHQGADERTAFGLSVQESQSGGFELTFFHGDLIAKDLASQPATTVVGDPLEARTWHHLAMVLGADDGHVDLYLDGRFEASADMGVPPTPTVCPQMNNGIDIALHDQGQVLGGRPPELVFAAVRKSNRYRIVRTDPSALTTTTVLSDPLYSYKDPDYLPFLDRLVFSSNESGSWEIWMSRGDGSERTRLTLDFGDAFRQIAARRPQWAPDGTGVVFESNVYDVVAGDNDFYRTNHLFYMGYDPKTSSVATELTSGATVSQLDYKALLASQAIGDVRITKPTDGLHHTRARWLTGEDLTAGQRGVLLYQSQSTLYDEGTIGKVVVDEIVPLSSFDDVAGLGDVFSEYTLLDARRWKAEVGGAVQVEERLVYQRSVTSYPADPNITLTTTSSAGETQVQVEWTPLAGCWDLDGDQQLGPGEDVDGDGVGGIGDCGAPAVTDLYVTYGAGLTPKLVDATGSPLAPGPTLAGLGKRLQLGDANIGGAAAVKVQITPVAYVESNELHGAGVWVKDVADPPPVDPGCDPANPSCPEPAAPVAGAYDPPDFEMPDDNGFVAVDGGTSHTLGLLESGAVVGFGDSRYGRTAIPDDLGGVVAVAAGARFSLALGGDGSLTAWGFDDFEDVFGSWKAAPTGCVGDPTVLPTVCVGGDVDGEACAADTDCVGSDPETGGTETYSCSTLGDVSAIAAGSSHALAVRKGRVVAWGCDEQGQLGVPASLDPVAFVTAHEGASAVVTTAGKVVSFGSVDAGLATSLAALKGVSSVAIAGTWALVIKKSGALEAVGAAAPTLTLPDVWGKTAQVVAGQGWAAALSESGAVLHLGASAPDGIDKLKPALVLGAGTEHAIAIGACAFTDQNGNGGIDPTETCAPSAAALPIPSETVLAVLHFDGAGAAADFAAQRKRAESVLLVKDLTSADPPAEIEPAGRFEAVEGAELSPAADRLLMAVISNARPLLLRTHDLHDAAESESLLLTPTRLSGISWVREEVLHACNWAGGYRHPQTGLYRWSNVYRGHKGGLDDLRVYSGKRAAASILSEAERGIESLVARGLDGQLPSQAPTCTTSHLECPPYHLCLSGQCVIQPCDPAKSSGEGSCEGLGGRCTLRPLSVTQDEPGPTGVSAAHDWVCAADCNNDDQCFTQECLNGPCRFCDPLTLSCNECRDVTKELGGLSFQRVEGCPDDLRWRCEAGACVSECFEVFDGQSVYVCDTTTEYCLGGYCVLHDWDWEDFAPATFGGLGEMRRTVAPEPTAGWNGYTQVVDQMIPVELTAHGVRDYGQLPEVLVEVSGGPFYGTKWHTLGRVTVTATTRTEAILRPIRLLSPYVFDQMRMRLITSPLENLSEGATGLGDKDEPFCQSLTDDPNKCYYRAPGSAAQLGYRVPLPTHEAIQACAERGEGGCPQLLEDEQRFLHGGAPAVRIFDITVDGASAMGNLTHNRVCGWEGYDAQALIPTSDGVAKQLFYGDISKEDSPAAKAWCAVNDCPALAGSGPVVEIDADKWGVLLNCNYRDPNPAHPSAEALFQNIVIVKGWPASHGEVIEDDGDTCLLEDKFGLLSPCHAWLGQDVVGDGVAHDMDLFASLQFTLWRSFGHDDGFTSVERPKRAIVVDPQGVSKEGDDAGLAVTWIGVGQPQTIDAAAGEWTAGSIAEGRRFEVAITTQPTDPKRHCRLTAPAEVEDRADESDRVVAWMPLMDEGEEASITLTLTCSTAKSVPVLVNSIPDGEQIRVRFSTFEVSGALIDRELADLTQNASAFEIPAGAPVGTTWLVEVVSVPEDLLCAPSSVSGTVEDIQPATLTCTPVVSSAISVVVENLKGHGLQVQVAGQVLKPAPLGDGASQTLATPAPIKEGVALDWKITALPDGPAQDCEVTPSLVVMPAGPAVGATVTCSDPPLYQLPMKVLGLKGTKAEDGAALALTITLERLNAEGEVLDTETKQVPVPASSLEVPVFSFDALFREEDHFRLSLQNPITDPPQTCVLAPDEGPPLLFGVLAGTWDGESAAMAVTCVPKVAEQASYHLGGSIAGLEGHGLKVAVNSGAETVTVDAGGTFFTFSTPLSASSDYTLTISKQPHSPTQYCEIVSGAKGQVFNADVTDVEIVCQDASTIALHLSGLSAFSGSHIKAELYRRPAGDMDGQLVATQPANTKIKSNGQVSVELVTPGEDSPAVVLSGAGHSYFLVVFVNTNSNFKGGTPHYEPGELAAGAVIDATAGAYTVTLIGQSGDLALLPALPTSLTLQSSSGDFPGKSPTCHWALQGTGSLLAAGLLPPPGTAPVVAESRRLCESGQCTDDEIVTSDNDPLPIAPMTYDVTCWIDNDDSNTVNQNDWIGTLTSVSAGSHTIVMEKQ